MSGAAEEDPSSVHRLAGTASAGADSSSRRRLLVAGGAAAVGLMAAGCGSSQTLRVELRRAPALMRSDVALLNHLLDVEHLGIAAYTAGTPLLTQDLTKTGELFLNDELAHAGELIGLVKQAGGKPNKPAPSYDLGHPGSSEEVLALLDEVENLQIAAYLDAIPQLTPAKLRQQVVEMLANDAQHITVLRAALGRPPVPSAFVTADGVDAL